MTYDACSGLAADQIYGAETQPDKITENRHMRTSPFRQRPENSWNIARQGLMAYQLPLLAWRLSLLARRHAVRGLMANQLPLLAQPRWTNGC